MGVPASVRVARGVEGATAAGGIVVGTGGSGTGGGGTGGATATGGAAGRGAGGTGTGGTGTGGASVGGSSGWLVGYTATMFGNIAASPASDCSGVANFTDATMISRATCTSQGFPVATYGAGVANAASFYGAPGDLSSMWVGPLCTCPAGQTTCVPSCRMEGDCGRCFEVKCDPAGIGSYSDGATRVGATYCNPNQSAVVQIIDACPHNHSNNPWWCTAANPGTVNHIDISCSAMKAIAGNPAMIGNWGWLNVQVRQVDCAVGLGAKTPIAP